MIAWEPVPQFRAFVEYGLALNNLSSLVTLRPYIASTVSGMEMTMEVPTSGVWGTASVGGINQGSEAGGGGGRDGAGACRGKEGGHVGGKGGHVGGLLQVHRTTNPGPP